MLCNIDYGLPSPISFLLSLKLVLPNWKGGGGWFCVDVLTEILSLTANHRLLIFNLSVVLV